MRNNGNVVFFFFFAFKADHWFPSGLILTHRLCRSLQARISSLSNAPHTLAPCHSPQYSNSSAAPATSLPNTSACNQSLAEPPTVLDYAASLPLIRARTLVMHSDWNAASTPKRKYSSAKKCGGKKSAPSSSSSYISKRAIQRIAFA